ncbi:MAG: hypothetical protein F4X64_07790 [Chloroflexi bacterium]|nr:hypothetical protein [Chloroflexota bacterium]
MSRYGIGEWYGKPLVDLTVSSRQRLARTALGNETPPSCPFQEGAPTCRKSGGVCSLLQYEEGQDGRIRRPEDLPVIVCPARFEQDRLLIRWLAEIVGLPSAETMIAREIPFMQSTSTERPAGKIDLVVGRVGSDELRWYALEIQAVYFSGPGMSSQFELLRNDTEPLPPYPDRVRRPDWRSSSAKRLMPQLQVKAPTVRRWQTKIAVAVDRPFFESIGGPSPNASRDINDGDVIWLVPELARDDSDGSYRLTRGHWEVLTLEASTEKLLAARTISRNAFEAALREKLLPLG